MIALGIDGGASSSRWLLRDEHEEIARGRGAPITGHLFTPGDQERTLGRLADLCAQAKAHATPGAVVAGITGLDRNSGSARAIADALSTNLAIPADRIRVMHDMDVAYHAIFAPGEGVLVYGGTGSIAFHMPAEPGAPGVRVGGHGYLIDDAGGGFWIGSRALQSVMRERDRLGARPATPLADAVYAHVGNDDWDAVREHVYGGGRTAVAALSVAVGTAAARGDEAALGILRQAGAELARLAAIMFERLGSIHPVALSGGVVRLGEPLLTGFREALPPGARFIPVVMEPVEAAARLALDGPS